MDTSIDIAGAVELAAVMLRASNDERLPARFQRQAFRVSSLLNSRVRAARLIVYRLMHREIAAGIETSRSGRACPAYHYRRVQELTSDLQCLLHAVMLSLPCRAWPSCSCARRTKCGTAGRAASVS